MANDLPGTVQDMASALYDIKDVLKDLQQHDMELFLLICDIFHKYNIKFIDLR